MKNLILLFALIGSYTNLKAVDIHVNNSGNAGTYTTISAALTAAVANDIIYISPYSAYTETINIDKSITLASSVSGVKYSVLSTMSITGAPNMEVKIIGCSGYNITFSDGTSTLSDKTKLYIIGSDFKNGFNMGTKDNIAVHALFSTFSSTIQLKHGEIRGCTTKSVTINEGSAVGIGDTLFIVGNIIKGKLNWVNDDHYFYVSNNYINNPTANGNGFAIINHLYNSSKNNTAANNTILASSSGSSGGALYLASPSNDGNLVFYNCIINNKIAGQWSIYSNQSFTSIADYTYFYNCIYAIRGGINANITFSSSGIAAVDSYGRGIDSVSIDQGFPSVEYYDTDLTRNDIGTFGGPYSINNYIDTATGNGRVYDLEIPFEIWSGQTPQVKAKSVNTK